MNGLARAFMLVAVLCGLAGMGWGIHMAASGDHLLAPAHAHLNLTGWVGLALFALYYHVVPGAAEGLVPRLHFGASLVGAVTFAPGIAIAVATENETLALVGTLFVALSMVLFAVVVLRFGRRA